MSNNEYIRVSQTESIGIITLDRPEVFNALNRQMVKEIANQLEAFDHDRQISVIIVNGSGRMFAAGADISEMKDESPVSLEYADPFRDWERIMRIKKPMIASVHGSALGGGFELALHCDCIIAAENSQFGFPEVTLGVLPGAGGTQLLTHALGRRKALEIIGLGTPISARYLYENGVVNVVFASEILHEETLQFARTFAKRPAVALRAIKESVLAAEHQSIHDGMLFERKNFYLTFATDDQKEGMNAFKEKRQPRFKGV
ncbi:enoyl-CoA hydratase [Geomicrobium sp. JCM 19037]|uniref:enoyl-CoA hydratase-related protein n=1 Tax=unclassified Geomicrobium TaxID=2628951 RepID=UPI00045F3C31|nr:enoyl-CoA hydratase-related protein [Geomicrobium sp. JCM 19037]GAK03143.1 enoyl-CoA hydratase [Geomicrobium sp. JCM 19037]